MIIRSATYVKSSSKLKDCPEMLFPEYAFVGRSNVGKSSLINMLTSQRKLAKTSVTPGKTRCINHFLINESWYLVDLPGIGYARVSQKDRQLWRTFIYQYLCGRKNLLHVFVLVDSRLEPQAIDTDLIRQLGTWQIPFSIVFTKTDKLNKKQLADHLRDYKNHLREDWEELPDIFISSSETKSGRDEILNLISKLSSIFDAEKLK